MSHLQKPQFCKTVATHSASFTSDFRPGNCLIKYGLTNFNSIFSLFSFKYTDTDILITHQPPYGILDHSANIHYGDLQLLDIVLKTKPRYHLFGHIHGAYGIEKSEQTTFVNASILSEKYELMYEPIMQKI